MGRFAQAKADAEQEAEIPKPAVIKKTKKKTRKAVPKPAVIKKTKKKTRKAVPKPVEEDEDAETSKETEYRANLECLRTAYFLITGKTVRGNRRSVAQKLRNVRFS